MRFLRFAVFLLLSFGYLLSDAQTPPGRGATNVSPFPGPGPSDVPVVTRRPEVAPTPETNRKRLLADLQDLISESETLSKEIQSATGATVSARSFKRAQEIESLSKKIRKALKN